MLGLVLATACHASPASTLDSGGVDSHGGDSGADSPATSDAAAPPGFVHVAGAAIVDGAGAPLALRCVNLGGWLEPEGYLFGANGLAVIRSPSEIRAKLVTAVGQSAAEAFWQQWEAAFITEADFTRIAALGFNCVRLPVNAKRIAAVTGSTVTLDPTELAPVDHAATWGAAHGVYVVLDLHATFGGANAQPTSGDVPSANRFAQLWVGANGEYPSATAAANQLLTAQLWGLLAARYASTTAIAGFDLVNEPQLDDPTKPSQSPVPPHDLVTFYEAVIAAIRAVDTHHLLFVEGDALAADFTAFTTPLDPNSAYEVHAYALTNQSPWVDPTVTPSPLDPLVALASAQQLPLWLGEFGENTQTWQREMISLVEAHGTGWAVWPWKRRATSASHAVVETIALPVSWPPVFDYLVGATATPPADPMPALADIVEAVRLANCGEDAALAATLVGP